MTKTSQAGLNGILPRFWRTIGWALLGCLALGLVIFVCFQLHTRFGIVALFCLLTIVILSLQGHLLVALSCSVLAALGLDYFFMQPGFGLAVTRPDDIAGLFTFLTIALVVSALGSKLRRSCWELARENAERKRAEEAWSEAQAQLVHGTRVVTLGELAGSIAHEVNQPLTAIINNANTCLALLPGETSQLADVHQGLSDIISDADRASAVIERIRGLIKKSPQQRSQLDLNETIGVVVALARGELQRNEVLLRTKLADDLPLVVGDRIQLQQVILNLIINAIEAMSGVSDGLRELSISSEEVIGMPGEPEEGWLADAAGVETERRPVRHSLGDPATAGPNAGLSNVIPRTHGEAGTPNADFSDVALAKSERRAPNAGRTCVLVSVADSGPGLDPKDLDRLFNTFYTTKPHGLGMGLSISRSIIEAHGGRLWGSANVPKGALFQFMLPAGRSER